MVNLIVACSLNNVIGSNNEIPWHISEDLKHFKEKTLNQCVIMGRKTFESIGRPLPGRENIVITSKENYRKKDCIITTDSLEKAIKKSNHLKEIFIIGGERVYKEALELGIVKKIYLTKINKEVSGDRFFHPPEKGFKVVSRNNVDVEGYNLDFIEIENEKYSIK